MRFLTAIIALITSTVSAHAIDFTSPVMNEDGVPYTVCAKAAADRCIIEEPMTLGRMIADALNQADTGMTPEVIVARGTLAILVRTGKDVVLDEKQRELVKTSLFAAVAKLGYKPTAVVRALEAVDPAAVAGK